jgi:diguanylate cyclase (GGDEF)-like protein
MRTVIVEDSAATLAALQQLLGRLPGVDLVGTAAAEDAAVDLIQARQPDLVLLDLGLADGSGLGVLRRLRGAGCAARVAVVTNRAQEAYRSACLAAGANAFFDKSKDHEALLAQLAAWLPPRPAREAERVQALRALNVLDTPPEAGFDSLTELAAQLLQVPIALISLVDEHRAWFKSQVGLAAPEASRSVSFCAHAVNGQDVFVVEDASLDPRFADNPLVTGPSRLRFYAGAPLVLRSGEVIGTLCVIDRTPRRLGATEQSLLRVLAQRVVVELELRRQVDQLVAEMAHRHQAQYRHVLVATRDPLTGLPNRAALLDRLQQALRLAAHNGERLALMFLDLDRFKYVNDSLGHAVGDELLQAVAERLQHGVRAVDTVAHLGGDAFAIVLQQPRDLAAVVAVVENLLDRLASPILLGTQALTVRASVGVAVYPDHGDSVDQLTRRADIAMCKAKEAADCGYRVYEPQFDLVAQSRLTLEQDLRDALARRELRLHYQPQVDMARGTLGGVEALLRWQHPLLGWVPPARFIPLAEQTGLIREIGDWVLQEATHQLARWRADGLVVPMVSVNISPLQLTADLLMRVAGSLRDAGLDPSDLELEITETAITADGPLVLELLSKLRILGVGVAVDDFGVGYSSLAMLRRLPVSTLKIDRCFVHEIDSSSQDATIIRTMIDLAQGLGLRLVAEGVESAQQRLILAGLGCRQAQGYLFSAPLPADALGAWLGEWHGRHR